MGKIFRWLLELAPLIALTILLAMFAWRRAFQLDWHIVLASAKTTIGWFLSETSLLDNNRHGSIILGQRSRQQWSFIPCRSSCNFLVVGGN